jgi:hypothetical protein
MNRLQVSLLTALIMLLAFRPEPLAAQGGVPVVCNDGQIPVSVARAYKDMHNAPLSSDWTVQGWYTVMPGQCNKIGPDHSYAAGNLGWSDGDYSLTLLAFAFTDSTGVWGAARVHATEEGGERYGFKPSNQQLCVANGAFLYTRDTSKGEPAKACDGLAGCYLIPVSLAYYGQIEQLFVDPVRVHVSLGPTDRAIPLGTQGPSQASSNTPAKPSGDSGDASPGLCGKVSCWDYFAQGLAKAAADERQKQDQAAAAAAEERQRQAQAAAEAQRQAELAAATPPPAPAPARVSAPNPDLIGGGGFITPPTTFKVMLCVPAAIGNSSSWNQPEAGSKMDTFKNRVASYIFSIAKPGWEYWIVQGQYERFDPSAPMSGDQIVSAVSPDSGRFDRFDPTCPSGYAVFLVTVKH